MVNVKSRIMSSYKAVVPIAGKGTRLEPITKVVPKALFPMVDRSKKVRAVLQVLLEEIGQVGIEDVAVIISPGQKNTVKAYLDVIRELNARTLPSRICFLEQKEPRGFGDAVIRAREFVNDEPFLLLLGDHIHISNPGKPSCVYQVVEAFRRGNHRAVVGMYDVDESVLHTMGIASGKLIEDRIFRCTEFIEKPSLDLAKARLTMDELPNGRYLGHCGIYVFDAKIFSCLEQERLAVGHSGGEIELAAAQARLLQKYPEDYYLYWIEGRAYDMGTPEGYLRTFAAFGGIDAVKA